MKKEFEVIEVAPSGKSGWYRGAWCLVWVYSSVGNFLLKGYIQECENLIKEKGWKCWSIYNLYYQGSHRTIVSTYNCGFEILQPSRIDKKKSSKDFKYRIYTKGNWENAILVKRLPGKFVNFNPPPFKELKGTLGGNDDLKSLKDKLSQNF